MISIILGKFIRVDLMGHRVNVCLTFYKTANLLSKSVVPFYTPQKYMRISDHKDIL